MNETHEDNHQLLISAHPIFGLPSTKIYWFETVQKINKHHKKQPRILVIASCGIFLIEKKTFPRSLVISRIIAYNELVLICADENSMQFFKPKVTMNLQHPRYLEAVALVVAIRKAMYQGEFPRPPKFAFLPQIQASVDKAVSSLNMEKKINALADRFLSLCLLEPVESLQTEQVGNVYNKLKDNPKSVDFDMASISPQLISAMATAVACDKNVSSIHIKKVCLPYFLKHFNEIVEHNSSIKNLYFHEVSFSGELGSFYDLLSRNIQFKCNSYSFLDCQLKTKEFTNFFEQIISKFTGKVKSISFYNAKVDNTTLKSIFNTIISSKSCLSLENLVFNGVKNIDKNKAKGFDLMIDSKFLTEHSSIKYLELTNDDLQLDSILLTVLNENSKINSLNLSGNLLNNNLQINNFYGIEKINFSSIQFTSESFANFLKSLSKCIKIPSYIVLDSLKVEKHEWDNLYKNIENISISGIKTLSWNFNQIQHENMDSFFNFLYNLPDLIELAISSTIPSSESGQFVSKFIPFINKKPIQKLELRGSTSFTFGSKLSPLLDDLLNQRYIKSLDISNQEINSDSFEILIHLSNNCLEELKFDGTDVNTSDFYIRFLEKIVESKLQFAQWPENDIKTIINKESSSQKKNLAHKFNSIKKRFNQKFKGTFTRESSSSSFIRRRGESTPSNHHHSKSTIHKQQQRLEMSIYNHDPNIEPLLLECFNLTQLTPNTEPLYIAMTHLNDCTSIDSFLSNIY